MRFNQTKYLVAAAALYSVTICSCGRKVATRDGAAADSIAFSWEAVKGNDVPADKFCSEDPADTPIYITAASPCGSNYTPPGERFKPRYY